MGLSKMHVDFADFWVRYKAETSRNLNAARAVNGSRRHFPQDVVFIGLLTGLEYL